MGNYGVRLEEEVSAEPYCAGLIPFDGYALRLLEDKTESKWIA